MKKLTADEISSFVREYNTKYPEGFTNAEKKSLLKEYNIDEEKFVKALGCYTATTINEEDITFRDDVEFALRDALEQNKNSSSSWD